MDFRTRLISAAFFIVIFTVSSLSAQLVGEVNQGGFEDYSIAAQDILNSDGKESELSKELTSTLRKDVELTGFFALLNPKGFLEAPSIDLDVKDFKNWLNIGANGLVKGFVKEGKESVLEIAFYDVAKGKKVIHKQYTSSPEGMRMAVHKFVRELVLILTGETINFISSKIVFVEKNAGAYSLVTTSFDGSDRRVLYSSNSIIALPSWSHDGNEIYFTSYSTGNPYLYAINRKTLKTRIIAGYEGLNTSADASPDGNSIALRLSRDGNSEIYVKNLKNGSLTRMTKNLSVDTAPSFSPDGKQIAFVSDRSGTPQIYRLFIDNPSRVERLTAQGNYNQDPEYSPDGKHIVFTGRDEYYRFDIFLFDLESRIILRLTQNQKKNENPSFSPDSRLIVFSSDRTGKNSLFISNITGNRQILIYSGNGEVITPSWSPELEELK